MIPVPHPLDTRNPDFGFWRLQDICCQQTNNIQSPLSDHFPAGNDDPVIIGWEGKILIFQENPVTVGTYIMYMNERIYTYHNYIYTYKKNGLVEM